MIHEICGLDNSDRTESDCAREPNPKGPTRRQFLGQVSGGVAATLAVGALAAPPVAAAQSATNMTVPASAAHSRVAKALALRIREANQDSNVRAARNVNNGDDALYADKGGTYTKGLPHDTFGRVDPAAYASFKGALKSGEFSDFQNIIVGGTRTQNGPQGGLAFDLEGLDSVQCGQPQVPPAPTAGGDVTATELLEHYWGALLRDVAFTDYGSNPLASQAAAELSAIPSYLGPRASSGLVTTDLLFRGGFPGESLGPYLSQFFVTPAMMGAQPLSQQMVTYLPNIDYMTSFNDWLTVQNGNVTGLKNQVDPQPRYLHDGRGLSAFTHVDVLYQAYFTALVVLGNIRAPLNPGNPYIGSRTQNGFGTFGDPDVAGTLAEVATRALNAVWYQKWFVHLRPRPEAIGGQVHLIKTGQADKTSVKPSPVVLNSVGLQQSFNKYGTWLLSQAFPEGSPTHPSYPTGHGTVGGACITVLKFFFDGSFVIPDPVVPTSDGLALQPYTGSDAGQLTVNGELNKLGHNVSFGHGIHAGIHWRSDTDTSLLLGEAVALSILKDRALTYNEPFTIHLTKFDGTIATISNQGHS
ncbi:MAG TPA: vanadium-dependent haloperoxidase [Blastocatellia bacterium]|nr:vanadium-dependent haloperoxidase [Blastocatellia bacterium]